MLIPSPLLLWAVAMLLKSGTADHDLCQYVDILKCDEDSIKEKCVEKCSKLDDSTCLHLKHLCDTVPDIKQKCKNACGVSNEDTSGICQHINPNQCLNTGVFTMCIDLCTQLSPIGCTTPWDHIQHQCIHVDAPSALKHDWVKARAHCGTLSPSGDLAQPKKISSLAEHLKNKEHMGEGLFWLGGSKLATNGEWLWNDGTAITITDFTPTTDSDKQCLAMRLQTSPTVGFTLENKQCTDELTVICQQY